MSAKEPISADTHIFFTDPNKPGQVFAIKRNQNAPANGQSTSLAEAYRKSYMKSYQPSTAGTQSEKESEPGAVQAPVPSYSTGLPGDVEVETEGDYDNPQKPGKPAEPGDPAEIEESGDGEEALGTQTRYKRKRIPADEKTLNKLKAVLEKNPFDYPEKSVERREAWVSAVKLANGDDKINVRETDINAIKAVVQRHLKTYKSIDNEDRPTGTERDIEVFDEYMQVMEQISNYKESAPLAIRKPEKAKKDAAIAIRARATKLAMTSGMSVEKFGDLMDNGLGGHTDSYDADFENGDLVERCDDMRFDKDELLTVGEDGQFESFSTLDKKARLSGSDEKSLLKSSSEEISVANESFMKGAMATARKAGKPAGVQTPKKSPFKGIKEVAEAARKKATHIRGSRQQIAALAGGLQSAVEKMSDGERITSAMEREERALDRAAEKEKADADRAERIQKDKEDRAERELIRQQQIEKEERDRAEREAVRKLELERFKIEMEHREKEQEKRSDEVKTLIGFMGDFLKKSKTTKKSQASENVKIAE